MKRLNKVIVIICTLLGAATTSYAQRTAAGLYTVSASALTDFSALGGEVSFGKNFLYSYMGAGVSLNNNAVTVNTGEVTEFLRSELFFDWMWRPYHTRDRRFDVYVGGELFIGLETLDPYTRLKSDTYQGLVNNGYQRNVFIYGGAVRLEAEYYFTPVLGLFLCERMPVTINSQQKLLVGCISFSTSAGFRLTF